MLGEDVFGIGNQQKVKAESGVCVAGGYWPFCRAQVTLGKAPHFMSSLRRSRGWGKRAVGRRRLLRWPAVLVQLSLPWTSFLLFWFSLLQVYWVLSTIQKNIKICPTRSCHLNRRLWDSLQRGRIPPAPDHLLKILPMCQMERGTGTGELGMSVRECRWTEFHL